MRTQKMQHRINLILLGLLLLWTVFPIKAFAREPIDLEQKTSLTIQHPCADVTFRIYQIADVSEYGEYTCTSDFAGYAVNLEQEDQAGWRALASTLSGYVARDEKEALGTKVTDTKGNAYFGDLNAGLYLVIGSDIQDDEYKYEAEAFLIALPGLGEDDKWQADVTASPKYEKEPVRPEMKVVNRKVIKIWKDDGEKKRPNQIEVQLLKDGKVFDTVTLRKEDNWKYEWKDLDANATWQIVEKEVPTGYHVAIDRSDSTFTITNTKDHLNPNGNKNDKNARLPQTGQLWWPVGILAVAGTLLFLIGWIRRIHEK